MSTPIYDSDAPPAGPLVSAGRLWEQRGLVRLLIARDISTRYKRSLLGVWWTLLNPLLEMLVLAAVFSQVFRFSAPGVPYVVYLLSGIIVANLFRNAIMRAAGSIAENAPALARLKVPVETFAVAAVLEVTFNFAMSLVPLAAIMVIAGEPVSLTAPLLVLPAALLVAFALGVGLALAPLVVRFPDALLLAGIMLTFVTYLAPVFYPVEIVPDRFDLVVELNPLYHFLNVFRANVYGGSLGALSDYAILLAYTTVALVGGSVVFARTQSRVLALL